MRDKELTDEEIDQLSRIPTCPFCDAVLQNAADSYSYKRSQPDTRWFWCPDCEAHLGHHRMRATWTIDPYDLPKIKDKGYLA